MPRLQLAWRCTSGMRPLSKAWRFSTCLYHYYVTCLSMGADLQVLLGVSGARASFTYGTYVAASTLAAPPKGVELFAAQFFGIGKVEAEAMDPQQRHLLETSFGAFGDSGYSRAQLMGLGAGVFVGQDKSDWNRMLSAAHAGPFAATGGSASISSNRISYSLGLKGPSATVDTACSSSLVAADTAAATIRRGRCELAAVCGVNMLLLPQTFIACCQARMLSADGRCHTFDASASGYTRGEGCGAQILGPSGTASAASPVAAFAGSALNQDGRSANLTSPNGPSQKAVIQVALSEAGLQPEQVGQATCLRARRTRVL